jgi:hypothetical protein
MTLIRYDRDIKGTAEVLTQPEMHSLVDRAAEAGKAFAVSISPDAPPIGEGYIESFRVETGQTETFEGVRRAEAQLWNDSPYAAAVEWEYKHHVLGKTVDFIEKWRPGG